MKHRIYYILLLQFLFVKCLPVDYSKVKVGAEKTEAYLPLLEGKRIAIMANHTSMVGSTHLVDTLLSSGVNVQKIFCPEHGFRGNADAGEYIKSYVDKETGIPVVSLYGNKKKPKKDDLFNIDLIIFDIQDVGVRFYTYISSLHYLMEACAENNIEILILDRPNPNGFYIDGPVLEEENKSFVGMHPVPLVHGMTIAEYALMINGEEWLKSGIKCKLSYITCDGYTHKSHYKLPIKPSPNLQNMKSIYLYPSLGFFEGTVFSAGRGTDFPFLVYGHPLYPNKGFEYTPRSIAGASKFPKFKGEKCYGNDLRSISEDSLILKKAINLEWLFDAYYSFPEKGNFFNNFFYKLAGTKELRISIEKGEMPEEIRKAWKKDLRKFKKKRKKYLLYDDFE